MYKINDKNQSDYNQIILKNADKKWLVEFQGHKLWNVNNGISAK